MPTPASGVPNAEAVDQADRALLVRCRASACDRRPGFGRNVFEPLEALAETSWRMPVVHFWASRLGMATDHPLHAGFDVAGWIEEADVILTIDSMVPWIPDRHSGWRTAVKVIQLGCGSVFPRPADAQLSGDAGDRSRSGEGA